MMAAGNLLDIFYPRRCPVCHDVLKISEGLVHKTCQAKLRYVQGPVCFRCGKPIMNADEAYCSDCQSRRHYYDSGKSVWIYDIQMQKSVAEYKYHGAKAYADFYAAQMAEVCGAWIYGLMPVVLVPVPVHWKKKHQRGFNQAAVLAQKLGKILDVPVDTGYLVRTQSTMPQKTLTPVQRYVNLKHAFKVRKKGPAYRKVLLVDDIYTTGSTIDACASVLKLSGTEQVYYISLCIGSDYGG